MITAPIPRTTTSASSAVSLSSVSVSVSVSAIDVVDSTTTTTTTTTKKTKKKKKKNKTNSKSTTHKLILELGLAHSSSADLVSKIAAKYGWKVQRNTLLFQQQQRQKSKSCEREEEDFPNRGNNLCLRWSTPGKETLVTRYMKSSDLTNRLPGMMTASDKIVMTRLLTRARRLGFGRGQGGEGEESADTFSFYPASFCLGEGGIEELEAFRSFYAAHPKSTFILKPRSGSEGNGIRLEQRLENIERILQDPRQAAQTVVQQYIASPLLLDGFKFDLRVYVLVESLCPLRVRVFREGLARFCTSAYEAPTCKNLHKAMQHLTNYSLNKSSENFVKATSSSSSSSSFCSPKAKYLREDDDNGQEEKEEEGERGESSEENEEEENGEEDDHSSKRRISTILRQLQDYNRSNVSVEAVEEAGGLDVDRFWGRIEDVAVKTLLAIQPTVIDGYLRDMPGPHSIDSSLLEMESKEEEPENNHGMRQAFHVIGFDFLLDRDLNPFLLEINANPSMVTDSALDMRIKQSVMEESLRCMGVLSENAKPCLAARRSDKKRKRKRKRNRQKQEQEQEQEQEASAAAAAAAAAAASATPYIPHVYLKSTDIQIDSRVIEIGDGSRRDLETLSAFVLPRHSQFLQVYLEFCNGRNSKGFTSSQFVRMASRYQLINSGCCSTTSKSKKSRSRSRSSSSSSCEEEEEDEEEEEEENDKNTDNNNNKSKLLRRMNACSKVDVDLLFRKVLREQPSAAPDPGSGGSAGGGGGARTLGFSLFCDALLALARKLFRPVDATTSSRRRRRRRRRRGSNDQGTAAAAAAAGAAAAAVCKPSLAANDISSSRHQRKKKHRIPSDLECLDALAEKMSRGLGRSRRPPRKK